MLTITTCEANRAEETLLVVQLFLSPHFIRNCAHRVHLFLSLVEGLFCGVELREEDEQDGVGERVQIGVVVRGNKRLRAVVARQLEQIR